MGTISGIFSILVIIFGGVSIMLVVNTKTLRDSRDDQEKRIIQLEDERTRDKSTIASQETAISFWRSAATGDEKLDKLSELVMRVTALLTEHHGEARANWIAVNAGLGHLGTSIDHMNDSIDRLVETLGEGQS